MDALSWIALIQPLVLLGVYLLLKVMGVNLFSSNLQYLDLESVNERLKSLEERSYHPDAAVLAQDIIRLDEAVNDMSRTIAQFVETTEKDSQERIYDQTGNWASQLWIVLIALTGLQLILAFLVLVLWIKFVKIDSRKSTENNNTQTNIVAQTNADLIAKVQ